jgi:hypothetical protein
MSRDSSKMDNLRSLWVAGLDLTSVMLIMKISSAISTRVTNGLVMNSEFLQELDGTSILSAILKLTLLFSMILASRHYLHQEVDSRILKKDLLKKKEVISYGDLILNILEHKKKFLVDFSHLTRLMVLLMNFNAMKDQIQMMAQFKMILL